MAAPALTTVSPEAPVVRAHGGYLCVSWRDSLKVAAPAQFGVWLVDIPNNNWYGGFFVDADGSGGYSRDFMLSGGFPDGRPLTPMVYYRDNASASWGGDTGNCYCFSPGTVTLRAFSVTSVEPAHAVAGTPVTVRGTGFTSGLNYVHFGGYAAQRIAVASDTEIVAYVPAGVAPGPCDVYVTCDGFTMGGASFTIDASDTGSAPNITSIDPATAEAGDTVAIHGTGLARTTSVRFGTTDADPLAAFVVESDLALSVLVPKGSGTVMVTVTSPFGSDAFEFGYPVNLPPVLTGLNPTKGFPGDVVALAGSGFTTVSAVSFGGVEADFLVGDDELIVCYVPEGVPAGPCAVVVSGPGGDSGSQTFTMGEVCLPITTASNVQRNGFDGWVSGNVTVTLAADPNGGPGVGATYYVLDNGGVETYGAPIVVSGAGSHHLTWWSVDVRGRIEPPKTGYVNILAASLVPAGLSVAPAGYDTVLAKWEKVASDSPVSYRLYQGPAAGGPWTKVADTVANVATVAQANADGTRYYAVAGVDVNGAESAKSAAYGPVTSEALPVMDVDWAAMPPITATKIADDAITTPKIAANAVTAAEIDVASIQAAVVTAAKVNTLALNASVISAGTINTARLDTAAIQAAVVTAAAVNALALNAGAITAGTIATARLDVTDIQTQVVTAAKINSLTLSAVSITGGSISGVLITGGTIRTTPTASGKRVEIDSANHGIRWYSGDAAETNPGRILPYTYSGGGGYISISGPTVSGQAMSSYISLHGATNRKDILLWGASCTVTIGDPSYPSDCSIGGGLRVSGGIVAGGINLGTSGITCGGSVVGGITLSGGVLSGASDVQASRFYTTANCASGVSADGVWINDLTTAARRWKLYMNNGQLYARYDSSGTGYKVIGP